MRYSDGYKENTYLTWEGEKYRVTPEFENYRCTIEDM